MTLSVIIPVYNVAPWLTACLSSVDIGGADIEIVCVDDGSSDGSGEILEAWLAKRLSTAGPFRVLHRQHGGVAAARNAALDAVSGDWVMFVDADDVLRPDWRVRVARALAFDPTADAVHFGSVQFADGECVNWPEDTFELNSQSYVDVMPDVFYREGFSCKVYSRRLIGATRFENRIVGEDCIFKATCLSRANRVTEMRGMLYGYRQRGGSAMHSALTAEKLRDELWPLDQYRLWRAGERRYPAAWWRRLAQDLTEFYAWRFFRSAAEIRTKAWDAWKRALLEIRGCPHFPIYNRAVLAVFSWCPVAGVAWMLFYVPQKLKTMGIHR